jgi:hypothetical protein
MAVVIAAGSAVSVAANTKSADQVTGQYQFVGAGTITLACKGSATGLNVTCRVGGMALVDDQPIPFTGTAGTISIADNIMANQRMAGGRVELFFRNTTGGALTADYNLAYSK